MEMLKSIRHYLTVIYYIFCAYIYMVNWYHWEIVVRDGEGDRDMSWSEIPLNRGKWNVAD